jgi:D-glycero-alpha-D-manno-heptose-7-phosphate kinase
MSPQRDDFASGKVVAQAPTRLCLIGGGTDVNPYAAEHQGAIINVAIDFHHRVTLRPRQDQRILVNALGQMEEAVLGQPIAIERMKLQLVWAAVDHFADRVPSGFGLSIQSDVMDSCGLGTSASAAVTLVGAFNRWLDQPNDADAVARLAFMLETQRLGWAGGKQDQWAAAYGGLNLTRYGPGEQVVVAPLKLDAQQRHRLQSWLVLIYVGGQRSSGHIQRELQAGMHSDNAQRQQALDELKSLALRAQPLLEAGDLRGFGELAHLGWEAKKRSNPLVTNARIDEIYRRGRHAGAIGGKLIGAGGAGFLYLLCPPEKRKSVIEAAEQLAAPAIDFDFEMSGLTTDIDGIEP